MVSPDEFSDSTTRTWLITIIIHDRFRACNSVFRPLPLSKHTATTTHVSCSQDVREPRFLPTRRNLDSISTRFFFPPIRILFAFITRPSVTIFFFYSIRIFCTHTLSFHNTHTLSVFFFISSVAYRFLNAPSAVYKRVCEDDRSGNETTTTSTYTLSKPHYCYMRTSIKRTSVTSVST